MTWEFAAFVLERGSYPLHFFGPVEDFFECRFHV